MTSSQRTSLLTEILWADALSAGTMQYFRARLKNKLHALVVQEFVELEKRGEITRADLAKRMNKRAEQVTRLLGAPGNWTLDTVSDLLLAMGCELHPEMVRFRESVTQKPFHFYAEHKGETGYQYCRDDMESRLLGPSMQIHKDWLRDINIVPEQKQSVFYKYLGDVEPVKEKNQFNTHVNSTGY